MTSRFSDGGTSREAATITLYCPPGTLSTLPARWSRSAVAATLSASSQRKPGTLVMSSPARPWNSVRTKPGATADACTPVPAS